MFNGNNNNYHYTNYTVNIKGELDTHMIFIDKHTNLLTYVYNITKSYDTFDLEEIEPLVAKKIKQMFDNKLLEKASIEPKVKFRYQKKGSKCFLKVLTIFCDPCKEVVFESFV